MSSIGIDEATFRYDSNGLAVRQMDPSRVAMIDFVFPIKANEEEVERAFTITASQLRKALKLSDVKIHVAELVTVKGEVYTKNVEITLPIIEGDEEVLPVPKVEYKAEAKIGFDDIKKALNVLTDEIEHLTFEAKDGQMTVTSKGDIQRFEMKGFNLTSGEGKAMYSWNYLKALKGTWNVRFTTDMPLKATKLERVGHGEEAEQIEVAVYLAPRIEVD